MEWTQDEAIAFEAAKECIGQWIAIHTSMIAEESLKAIPDTSQLITLRAKRSKLAQERAALHVSDHADIARIRASYGAMIRAWREEQHKVAA